MFTSTYFRISVLVVFIAAFNLAAAGQHRRLTTFDYPGATATFALGNNPAGDIVGAYTDLAGDEHGFLLRNGVFTSFEYAGALWTDAYGINPRGDIVGQYGSFDGVNYTVRGFLLTGGEFYPIDTLGQQNTMPYKISPEGTIVGCNHHNISSLGGYDPNTMFGFTRNAAGDTDLTISRAMNTGVNAAGDVVGYYFGTATGAPSPRVERSYFLSQGTMTFFQYPGALVTQANDVNENGTIVGRYRLPTPRTFHGFLLRDGSFTQFDVPGAANIWPCGINAKGQVVGYYVTAGVFHSFVFNTRGLE